MSVAAQGRRLAELAELVGGRVEGDGEVALCGVASLAAANPRQLAVFHHPRYRDDFRKSNAGAVIVGPDCAAGKEKPAGSLLVVSDPYLAFARLSALFHPAPHFAAGRHPSAVIEPGAEVDPSAAIGALCFVGEGAVVGPDCRLHPGVVIGEGARLGRGCTLHGGSVVREGCRLGDRVVLQPGAVVGSDGFGYAYDAKGPEHVKVPQVGIVRIEDDVEIGANVCINRATLGETVIGRGSKIDNLVQVAHNVTIGPYSLLCAQVGVAGSSELGKGVVLAGQVGIIGHLKLGEGSKVGAQSGVMTDLPAGETYSGSPAQKHADWLRAVAALRALPDALRGIARLRKRLETLENERSPKG